MSINKRTSILASLIWEKTGLSIKKFSLETRLTYASLRTSGRSKRMSRPCAEIFCGRVGISIDDFQEIYGFTLTDARSTYGIGEVTTESRDVAKMYGVNVHRGSLKFIDEARQALKPYFRLLTHDEINIVFQLALRDSKDSPYRKKTSAAT